MSDLRALIMALPNPIILIDGLDRISGANRPAKDMIGADCDGWHYITALRQPVILDAVEETSRDAVTRRVRYLGNDGARDTTWDVTVSRADVSSGTMVVLSFQDITAVEEAGEMRRNFVANVSHEMRTPLTSLMGFIETLRGPARGDDEAQMRFLAIMEQEAGRMHALVEDLLALSRVEGQERVRPTEAVDLGVLLGEVIASLTPLLAAKGVTIEIETANDTVEVLGDRAQLWQVLSNLIENAIKYGADKDTVTVRITAPTHQPALRQIGVQISVIDHGEGIAAHHIPRLTERFYRIDSHRSREVGGTGLGLAITKHIINRHRGRLRIESIVGQGADFTVILPIGTGTVET